MPEWSPETCMSPGEPNPKVQGQHLLTDRSPRPWWICSRSPLGALISDLIRILLSKRQLKLPSTVLGRINSGSEGRAKWN